ncbi:MAG: glycerate kinase [Clostridia bacterium]|nr:glycerate kinase [Clostridia bacterium]
MKFVVAPDSFKGSLSAVEAANAMEEGIKRVFPHSEVVKKPIADGGEGTVDALIVATGGKKINVPVKDPLGRDIEGFLGILGDGRTAAIEMAAASGLTLLKEKERNPLITSTYGTGQLILKAVELGCQEMIIGIGGSATNDGGAGMAQALGVVFLDKKGRVLPPGGQYLKDLAYIDVSGMDRRLKKLQVMVACDVDNPLYGERGASRVYGPQKGATPDDVIVLDEALKNYAKVIKEELGIDVAGIPGGGAAGGLGAGLVAFLNGILKPGIEIVLEAIDFESCLKDAALVLTGEGRIDEQTAYGKAPIGIARVAQKHQIPVLAFAGALGDGFQAVYSHGIDFVSANIQSIIGLDEAIQDSYCLLVENVERAMRAVKTGMKLSQQKPVI